MNNFTVILLYLISLVLLNCFNSAYSFDICINHKCKNGASCIPWNKDEYKCDCNPGYQGKYCETKATDQLSNLNPCNPNPCKQKSECVVKSNNDYRCLCPIGWQGKNCENNVDDCASNPCQNNGQCIDQPNHRYLCVCHPKFSGIRCEYDNPCYKDPCGVYGKCEVKLETLPDQPSNALYPRSYCRCNTGFTGPTCSVDVNECNTYKSLPCDNGGVCVNLLGTFRCDCLPGYKGDRCEHDIRDCRNDTCKNGGICLDKVGRYECVCTENFHGKNCEIPLSVCEKHPCQNNGQCHEKSDGTYYCNCKSGWTGQNCEIKITPCHYPLDNTYISPCKNGGKCVVTKNYDQSETYTCQCKPGYRGKKCETIMSVCERRPCKNNGICREKIGGGFYCTCEQEWTGKTCEIKKSPCHLITDNYNGGGLSQSSSPCENDGKCLEIARYDGSQYYQCQCKPGYSGKNCELNIDDCLGIQCQNGGTCIDQVNSWKCSCQTGYEGRYCEHKTNLCSPNPCLYGAKCELIQNGANYKCYCLNGLLGKNCQINPDDCATNPCQNNGICIDRIGGYVCKCPHGYVGLNCDEKVSNNRCAQLTSVCTGGTVCKNEHNSTLGYRCVCPEGVDCIKINKTCERLTCLNNGHCIREDSNINSEKCICPNGYTGPQCETQIQPCLNNPCQHAGKCIDLPNDYFCDCTPGYYGKNCEINKDECKGDPCGENGKCIDLINGYQCQCYPPFTGNNCEQNLEPCRHNNCANDAMCVPTKNYDSYICNCSTAFGRYTGSKCEEDVDECKLTMDQLKTYNLLLPQHPNHKQSIRNQIDLIEKSQSIISPCVNNATCINTFGSFVCRCQPGFEGNQCEINIDNCANQPCENGGACVDKIDGHQCHCPPGYRGPNCEIDVNECDPNPCQNDAICLDHVNNYQCICPIGFSGKNCHINDNDCTNSSCAGGGKCIDLVNGYRCECYHGYTGKYCQHQIQPCDRNPCQNDATCTNLNLKFNNYKCNCRAGYTGPHCEYKMDWCRGNPCGEHGSCQITTNKYRCLCNDGYSGERCELKLHETCAEYAKRTLNNSTAIGRVCHNHGDCVDLGKNRGFMCSCQPGYQGTFCQIDIDDCASQPCQNGGKCHDGVGLYNCECAPGFIGINCQQNRDECITKPCKHGICVDQINNFTCICPPGIKGRLCDQTEDMCTSVICQNGGNCESKVGGFNCKCKHGFTGRFCEIDINECRYSSAILSQAILNKGYLNKTLSIPHLSKLGPCSPYGTQFCVDKIGDYECKCKSGWIGKHCTKKVASFDDNKLCDKVNLRCSLPGKCVKNRLHPQGYECVCPEGYGGENCQFYSNRCKDKLCQNGGICRPTLGNITNGIGKHLGYGVTGYQCKCPKGVGGLRCELDFVNSCQEWKRTKYKDYCYNQGTCEDGPNKPKCYCGPGYCGDRCEIKDPLICNKKMTTKSNRAISNYKNETHQCIVNNCLQKRNNKQCDVECDHLACDFDGSECLFRVPDVVEKSDVQLAKPWSSCNIIKTKNIACQLKFMDGQCDPECNTENCLYDGWDCQPKPPSVCPREQYCSTRFENGHCDMECNTAECNFDGGDCTPTIKPDKPDIHSNVSSEAMILILPISTENFLNNYEYKLLASISRLLRLPVKVKRSETGQKMVYPIRVIEDQSQQVRQKRSLNNRGKPGTKVFLDVDSSYCRTSGETCFETTEIAAEFVSASLYKKKYRPPVDILSVQAKLRSKGGDDNNGGKPRFGQNLVIIYIMFFMFIIIMTMVAIGVLYGFVQNRKSGKNLTMKAKTWFPDGMKRPITSTNNDGTKRLGINSVISSRKRTANHHNDGLGLNNNNNNNNNNSTPVDSSIDDNNSGGSHSLTSTRLTFYDSSGHSAGMMSSMQDDTTTHTMTPNYGNTASVMACSTPLLNNMQQHQQHQQQQAAAAIFPNSNSHHQFITNSSLIQQSRSIHKSASQASLLLNENNNLLPQNYPPEKRLKMNQMNDCSSAIASDLEMQYFSAISNLIISGTGLGDLSRSETQRTQAILEDILKSASKYPYITCNSGYYIQTQPCHQALRHDEIPNNLFVSILTRTIADTGETLLHLAAKYNRPEAAKVLLEAGSDPNIVDNSGRSAFMVAVNAGAYEVVRELLDQQKFPIDLQARGPGGTTCLMEAVKHSQIEILELLLHHTQPEECDLNVTDDYGRTALHWAAATDQGLLVHYLLQFGFNRDAQDLEERTPLFLAASEGCFDVVRILLISGCNPDMGDHMDQLPIDIARKSDYMDIVQLLEQHAVMTKETVHHQHHQQHHHHPNNSNINIGIPNVRIGSNGTVAAHNMFNNNHHHHHHHPSYNNLHLHHSQNHLYNTPGSQNHISPTQQQLYNNWQQHINSTTTTPSSYFHNPTYATPNPVNSKIWSQQLPPPVPSHQSQRLINNTPTPVIQCPPPSTKLNPLLSPSYTKIEKVSNFKQHSSVITPTNSNNNSNSNNNNNGLTPSTDSESPGHWSTSSPSLSPRSRNLSLQHKLNNNNSTQPPHTPTQQQQVHYQQQLHLQSTNNNCYDKNTSAPSSSSSSSVLHYHPSPKYEPKLAMKNIPLHNFST